MKIIYPAIIVLVLLIAAAAFHGAIRLSEPPAVELSRESLYYHYDFTREVLASCPIERAELNKNTRELIVFYPREEYRDLLLRLEYQGWVEKEGERGRYTLGGDAIVVERGKLTILPTSSGLLDG